METQLHLFQWKKFLWASCMPEIASTYAETTGIPTKIDTIPWIMIINNHNITLYNKDFPFINYSIVW